MAKRTSKAKAAVDSIAARTEKAAVCGYMVWWSLMHDKEIARPEMEKIVGKTLGKSYMPAEPPAKRALRRGLEAAEEAGIIVKIRDDDAMTAYGLGKETKDEKKITFDLEKLNLVIFDKETKKLEFRGDYKQSEIQDLFERYCQFYTARDTLVVLLGYVKGCGAVTMRKNGGIYLMRSEADVNRLKDFIETTEGECYILPIADTKTARKQMLSLVKAELERDVELAAEEVKLLTGSDKSRASTFEHRLEEFKALQAKCSMFADLLTVDAAAIQNKVKELTQEVTDALLGQMEEFKQAEQFPYGSVVRYTPVSKPSQQGKVVGYYNKNELPYVKVLLDDDQSIKALAVKFLSVV